MSRKRWISTTPLLLSLLAILLFAYGPMLTERIRINAIALLAIRTASVEQVTTIDKSESDGPLQCEKNHPAIGSSCSYLVGTVYWYQGRYTEAAANWHDDEAAAQWVTIAGIVAFKRGHNQEAIHRFQTVLEITTEPALVRTAHYYLGRIAADDRRWMRTLNHYRIALHIRPSKAVYVPTDGEIYLQMGETARAQKNWKLAENYLKRATAYPDVAAPAYHMLGYVYFKGKRDLESAAIALRRADALDPSNPRPLTSLAGFYREEGMDDEAIAIFEQVLSRRSWVWAYVELGQVYLDQGEYDLAMDTFLRATVANPAHYAAWAWAGNLSLYYLGDYQGAIKYYEKALAVDDPPVELWRRLAVAYENAGDLVKAQEAYRKAQQEEKGE